MSVAQFMVGPGLAGISQLLDEHHLVVLSDDHDERTAFGRTLKYHLSGFGGSQVVDIPRGTGQDMAGLGEAIYDGLGLIGTDTSDLDAVVEALRPGVDGVRMRYLIWNDAEEMLENDVELFGRVTQGLLAVAAEHEHLNPEPLILHRVIFMGGPKLGAYAEEENGQFCSWLRHDGPWNAHAVGCVPRPPVITYRLDG